MDFHTPVGLPESCLQLTPSSRVMLIGSCFAEHIGRRMAQCLPPQRLCVNPFGVLYNPGSIYNALIDLTAPAFDASGHFLFRAADGLWHNWHGSTLLAAPQKEELLAALRERWEQARSVLNGLNLLCVTFSTDHAYYLADGPLKGTLVANCHKQPASLFAERVLDPDELCDLWAYLLRALSRSHPALKVVFTLSPYRYQKYGFHENALSKARQLLLIDRLCADHENAAYFPAYEIITDELRDYRFYEADMLHPSEQAVQYVWEKFCQWAFTPRLADYANDRRQLLRGAAHRPLHPESPEYLQFKARWEEKKRLFEQKWGEPFVP